MFIYFILFYQFIYDVVVMYVYTSVQHCFDYSIPIATFNDYDLMPYNKIGFHCQNEVKKVIILSG